MKPNDFASCKYGRFDQLIWAAYKLIYHHGKMRSYSDEKERDFTYVDDIDKVDIFSSRTIEKIRKEDSESLSALTGVKVDSNNGLFNGIILGFPENLSVGPVRDGHGYSVVNAVYSSVSEGTKKLINEKLGKKFL